MRLSYTPPPGWDFSPLAELARPVKGSIRIGPFGSALKKHEYSECGVRVLGIEDVHPNRFVSDKRKYIPEAKFSELRQYEVSEGDILVTNMGTVGRACVVPIGTEKSIISSHLIKVSVDQSKADPTYLCWMLNSSPLVVAQIKAKSHGAIMAGFNSSLLKSLQIPLPPLAEQKRIAAILDAADALRAKRRESLVQLDTLLQSTFLEMFGDPVANPKGWDQKPIQDVFDVARGGSPRPIQEYLTDSEDGLNWIMIGDANEGSRYITSTKKRIRREGLKKSRMVRSGDFLLTNSMSFGKPYILRTDGCIHDGWLVLSPKDKRMSADYFYSLLSTDALYREFARRASGAVVKNLNTSLVKQVPVAVPPLDEQDRFAANVGSVESQKKLLQSHLSELDTLFASLQSHAFSGEL